MHRNSKLLIENQCLLPACKCEILYIFSSTGVLCRTSPATIYSDSTNDSFKIAANLGVGKLILLTLCSYDFSICFLMKN